MDDPASQSPVPGGRPANVRAFAARAERHLGQVVPYRLGVAGVRGLLLDLLATGDRAGVDDAYEQFLRYTSAPAAPM